MFPTLLSIGPLTLHSYGLLVAIGFLIGMNVLKKTIVRSGLPERETDTLAVTLLVSGIIGARVMYFAVDGFGGLSGDPLSFFRIWEGGLAFYGGVIGALVAAAVYARRKKVRFAALTDAAVPPLLIAHSFGRLGCLAAGCCYGRPSGDWPGIVFNHPASLAPQGVPLVPTQIMEAAFLAALFGLTYRLSKRSWPDGRMTAVYLMGYGVLRFVMEIFRGDDRGQFIAGLSPSQAVAVVAVAAGVIIYGKTKTRA